MASFINDRCDPVALVDQGQLLKFATGKHLPAEAAEFKLTCILEGQKEYNKFRDEVFIQKFNKLRYPLLRKKVFKRNNEPKCLDVAKETSHTQRIIEIARERGYTIDTLLTFELASTSFFLTKDGVLQKNKKIRIGP